MRIELRDGAASRTDIAPLFHRVYPPHVLRDIVWRDVVAAPATERVVLVDDVGEIIAAVGLINRHAVHDGLQVQIGGIGGVMVMPDRQRQGLGRRAMLAAHDVLRARPGLQFGLLFCEPHNLAFYEPMGWRRFQGAIAVDQPAGPMPYRIMEAMTLSLASEAPVDGSIDLCGLPW